MPDPVLEEVHRRIADGAITLGDRLVARRLLWVRLGCAAQRESTLGVGATLDFPEHARLAAEIGEVGGSIEGAGHHLSSDKRHGRRMPQGTRYFSAFSMPPRCGIIKDIS